ncbi:hypothetical protein [Virgibacillus sp. 6R]|uniref:hypothetical protein n=1 Tax=Metabacillus sp. 22489 TaxID=3453928 RepID=UPI0011A2B6E2
MRKLLKKVSIVLIGISILSLLGCSDLNEETANVIEEKLSEKYNESFEVKYLGERWGTKSNDTVTTYVKAVDSDIMFTAVMDKSWIVNTKLDNFFKVFYFEFNWT